MSARSPFPTLHARAGEAAAARRDGAREIRDRADELLAEIEALLAPPRPEAPAS